MLIVRQTYKNRILQTHAKVNIKTTNASPIPEPLTAVKLENQLNQSIAFVSGTASTFLRWVHEFKKNHLNQLPLGDQDFFKQLEAILKYVTFMVTLTLMKMSVWKLQLKFLTVNIGISN